VQFQVDEVGSGPASLLIQGQGDDNPVTFSASTGDISLRPTTAAAVLWEPAAWDTVGEAGPNQRTTDLSSVIQEIVDRPGWSSSNALVLIITGTGTRVAESYNGYAAVAPMLYVEFTLAPGSPPVAADDTVTLDEDSVVVVDVVANDIDPDDNLDAASANTTCTGCTGPANGTLVDLGSGVFEYTPDADYNGADSVVYEVCDTGGRCDTAMVSITVTALEDPPVAMDDEVSVVANIPLTIDVVANDRDPDGNLDPSTTTTACDACGEPAYGTLVDGGDGTFIYTPDVDYTGADSFVYEVCDTGGLCDIATVSVTVYAAAPISIEVRVAAGTDDAEERATGSMYISSSDLEMVDARDNQRVGLRFVGVAIPRGAVIQNAYVQFQVDETNSEPASLLIQGQADDDPVTFSATTGDISSRPTTAAASVLWEPAPWDTVGEAGTDQRTTDLSSVIQEIVDRPGWSSGNALVLIITGTGRRVAESYNGYATAAPLLHLEYRQ
jgi:hypothetical protein